MIGGELCGLRTNELWVITRKYEWISKCIGLKMFGELVEL